MFSPDTMMRFIDATGKETYIPVTAIVSAMLEYHGLAIDGATWREENRVVFHPNIDSGDSKGEE